MYKIARNPIGSAIKYIDEIEAEMEPDQSELISLDRNQMKNARVRPEN